MHGDAAAHPARFSLVLVAAGSGARMGLQSNKVLAPLCGSPVLWHALSPFVGSHLVDAVVAVAARDEASAVGAIVEGCLRTGYGPSDDQARPAVAIELGGRTRQESVLAGLRALWSLRPPTTRADTIVLIHDAARPCLVAPLVQAVVEAVVAHGAASLAAPVKDTVKLVARDGMVERTLERAALWAVQTPQGFRLGALLAAAIQAETDGFQASDDCSIAEHYGMAVKLVPSPSSNIKITTPDDLFVAERILQGGC